MTMFRIGWRRSYELIPNFDAFTKQIVGCGLGDGKGGNEHYSISRIAEGQGWVCVGVSAREGMLDEILWQLRSKASHLLAAEKTSEVTSVQAGPIAVSRELHTELPSWRTKVGGILDELGRRGVGLLFTVDELNPQCTEFSQFLDVYQHFVREEKDVALLLAGLPSRVSSLLLDENVSFIRRAFQRPMDPIPLTEVEESLLNTLQANGRAIDSDALTAAAEASGGFAFAIQLVGYYLWREGDSARPLARDDVANAVRLAAREMERSVFLPTLRELRPREAEYLEAMARDEGPSSTSDIARRMEIGMSNASNLRRRLIEHGVIREVRMGLVEFEMPLLQEYLQAQLSR